MERIASFSVDHRNIGVGMYISRIDGDIVTYDVRMCKPNGGEYLYGPAAHTIEHLFATYARNSEVSDKVVYVGPMGCMTGFYLLTRDLPHEKAIKLVRDSMQFISEFDGEIPGSSEPECGNYLYHDLRAARIAVAPILFRLEDYTVKMLDYNAHN